jgi:hypothetical protein
MAVKQEKFNAYEMQVEFFSDTAMVGIVCPLPAYHFCWLLNRHFEMNFRCAPELTIPFCEDGVTSYFAVYQYLQPDSNNEYLLYKVKNEATYLLPRLKKGNWLNNIDYLLLLKTANPGKDATGFSTQLGKVNGIILTRPVDAGQIEHLENLLV